MNACHGFTAQPSNFSVSGGSAQFVFVFVNCDGYCSSGVVTLFRLEHPGGVRFSLC